MFVAKISGHNSTLICKKGVVNDEFKGSHKNQCRKAMSCLLPNALATFGKNSCFSDRNFLGIPFRTSSESLKNFDAICKCPIDPENQTNGILVKKVAGIQFFVST